MIGDSTTGRGTATAMRDLLRGLDRSVNGSHPARPNHPPAGGFSLARAISAPVPAVVTIGAWTLSEDPDSGDLIATHSQTGATTTVARKEP